MPIIEPAIKPPSEANSFLFQNIFVCSADSCTFCHSYYVNKFKIKSTKKIFKDIKNKTISFAKYASNYLPITGRLPNDKESLLNEIKNAINDITQLRPKFL